MRTETVNIYKFDELSEAAQKNALKSFWDINIGYGWWRFICEDSQTIGLKITEFDLDRGTIKGELINSLLEVCDLIFLNHGEMCETYKTAQSYRAEWTKLVAEYSDGINKNEVCEDKESEFDELADELEKQFRLSLCEDYRIILQHDYDYLTSTEAIKESIMSNEYEFTIDGVQY